MAAPVSLNLNKQGLTDGSKVQVYVGEDQMKSGVKAERPHSQLGLLLFLSLCDQFDRPCVQ